MSSSFTSREIQHCVTHGIKLIKISRIRLRLVIIFFTIFLFRKYLFLVHFHYNMQISLYTATLILILNLLSPFFLNLINQIARKMDPSIRPLGGLCGGWRPRSTLRSWNGILTIENQPSVLKKLNSAILDPIPTTTLRHTWLEG